MRSAGSFRSLQKLTVTNTSQWSVHLGLINSFTQSLMQTQIPAVVLDRHRNDIRLSGKPRSLSCFILIPEMYPAVVIHLMGNNFIHTVYRNFKGPYYYLYVVEGY